VLADGFTAEALQGPGDASHGEVIFLIQQVEASDVTAGARHPRNNPRRPAAGIFGQRGRNRPNRIASTICRIRRCEATELVLSGLDPVDGTLLLVIRPVMANFLPREAATQPRWSHEPMRRDGLRKG
jgi:tRNA (adenine37-N6)-methyltransferase